MSLTEEAYRERKWSSFPALRRALEDKQVPGHYYGLTSAHDNMLDALARLIGIAVLAVEFSCDIREMAMTTGREEMYRDLRRLEESLEDASNFFKRKGEEVRTLSHDI